ncbi:GNAT family N-acetyltransferase [Massilia endophytica]|uniref:GNAT family N-acetyltransferase n=1 Tax=Massilia endophytica TaxID=2899220 RepID=UPI001E2C51A8|nr:GNAT family N-acetyltransferase [Massilia endophytica]UGQ48996.1 GNAT family N-acetyltransferase [Massilia endophytica]
MGFEIRKAAAEDAGAACQVLRRSIAECCVQDHRGDPVILDAWLGNKTPQMVASWFDSPTNHAFVAVRGGAVEGVGLLTSAGKLALCYLLPEARGQGGGKAMVAHAEELAKAQGMKSLFLHSTATAEAFFASLGYAADGNVRSPYGVETILFWKSLTPEGCAPDAKRKRFCNCSGN